MAHPRVKEILDYLWKVHQVKDADYSGGVPLSNFKTCEQFGVPAWIGASTRLADKWSRFISLMRPDNSGPKVEEETVEETLRDLAVYAVIVLVLKEEFDKPSREG
jgi:hypothetical protein